MKAIWNGAVIAQSDRTEVVENNHYFPRDSLAADLLRESSHRSRCGWKGEAHYYDVVVDGSVNANAAWYYPEPLPAAAGIRDRVAFWKGVQIVD
jgi:uncharacterized protein (DUF427 family)